MAGGREYCDNKSHNIAAFNILGTKPLARKLALSYRSTKYRTTKKIALPLRCIVSLVPNYHHRLELTEYPRVGGCRSIISIT